MVFLEIPNSEYQTENHDHHKQKARAQTQSALVIGFAKHRSPKEDISSFKEMHQKISGFRKTEIRWDVFRGTKFSKFVE